MSVFAGGAEERGPRLQMSVSCLFHAQKPPDHAAGGSHCLCVPLPAGELMNLRSTDQLLEITPHITNHFCHL